MDSLSRSWYLQQCERALSRKNGDEFQDFFATVMELSFPRDFQRVRPYGNRGDLKCDGYQKSTETVFQVYAPRAIKLANLAAKVQADFDGALKHWAGRMQNWAFVHNDPAGLPADICRVLRDLEKKAEHIGTEVWDPNHLQSLVLELAGEHLARLFGPAPTLPIIDSLGFDRLRPVLINVKRQEPPPQTDIRPVSVEKLDANAFSAPVVDLLRIGRRKDALVGALLAGWPEPAFGEELAEAFRRRYAELKGGGLAADEVFGELQRFAGGAEVVRNPAYQAAVLAVLAYFFERCDIFEDRAQEEAP